jgi:hypothetical protein
LFCLVIVVVVVVVVVYVDYDDVVDVVIIVLLFEIYPSIVIYPLEQSKAPTPTTATPIGTHSQRVHETRMAQEREQVSLHQRLHAMRSDYLTRTEFLADLQRQSSLVAEAAESAKRIEFQLGRELGWDLSAESVKAGLV